MAKVFLDTNILLYTVDKKDLDKHERSRAFVRTAVTDHVPVISVQVLQEFYSAATSKLNIDKIVAKNLIHGYRTLETVVADLALVEQAIDISVLHQLSFWDSLIVAAAEHARCAFLASEDLNAGQTIRGVTIVNPFRGPGLL